MAVINTNYLSLVAQGNLTKSQNALGTAIERLSSGLRINSAKDDAAGQAIANRFTSNIKGLTQAARNANDGISIAQTTEGALNEINNNLQRVRELTVQAANGSNSQSDLDSIQSEIQQRLGEIDRVSAQTQFNGINVLAKDSSLKIQVGSNDSETISINLKEITAKTLGLDGFNVNGSGVTQNRAATVSDISAARGEQVATGSADWTVTTKHAKVTAAQAFDQLQSGDTVVLDTSTGANDATTYTYNAANNSFTYTDKSVAATGASATAAATAFKTAAADLVSDLTPTSGSKTATYEFGTGNVATFEVDAQGNLTIGGAKAYLTDAGEMTTNATGGATQATLEDVLTFVAQQTSGATPTLKIDGTEFTGAGGTNSLALSYEKTISKDALLNKFTTEAINSGAASESAINLNSGLLSAKITFAEGGKEANATFVDGNGGFTTIEEYTTTYTVDPDNGSVTVKSNDNAVKGTKYEVAVGATVNVNSAGKLTTDATSKGALTTDPLAALDSALASVDSLRSDLGAIQNRFESTITNLNNTITNLSSARSRIEDADYAVEVSNMTRAQILQQAGTSVLAQANQVPQGVLSLLG